MHLCRRPRVTRVAEFAIFDRPGDVTVVAGAAVLPVDDLHHVDVIAARLESEAQVSVTDLAAKSNAMKPVWKDNRAHLGVAGVLVEYNVPVFGGRWRWPELPGEQSASVIHHAPK